MVILNSRDQRIDPSGAACLETTDHAGCGPCEPSALINVTHLSSSPGRKPLGPSTECCRQPSHMGGRQQWGNGAFRWLLRLHPAPQDTATFWKTTEEIKWKHKSDTRFLPFPRARHPPLFNPQHRKAEPTRLGLLWRGPVGIVALSQNSPQLVLSPNPSSPKELGAPGLNRFLTHP